MMSSAAARRDAARAHHGAEQAGHRFHRLGIVRMQAAGQDRLAALVMRWAISTASAVAVEPS